MVMLHTAWAIYVTNYNGMLLNIRAFSRDFLTANTIAAGLSEIGGVLLAWLFVMKTPQKKWYWTGIFNISTGILTCFGFFIPETRKWFTATSYNFPLNKVCHKSYNNISISLYSFSARQCVRDTWNDTGHAVKNGNDMLTNGAGIQHR